jgi:hypothetical protein
MKERRQQFALGQIAGSAEDNQDSGIGDAFAALGQMGKIVGAYAHVHGGHAGFTSKDSFQLSALSFQLIVPEPIAQKMTPSIQHKQTDR